MILKLGEPMPVIYLSFITKHIQYMYAYCNNFLIIISLPDFRSYIKNIDKLKVKNMAAEKEVGLAEIVRYQCDVHEKDLVPLL